MAGDVLAIVGAPKGDRQLIEAIAHLHPRRITVLIPNEARAAAVLADQAGARTAPRTSRGAERIGRLLRALERRTGAAIVGLADSREQLRGWRFDRIVEARS
jgi:hypothetical protein